MGSNLLLSWPTCWSRASLEACQLTKETQGYHLLLVLRPAYHSGRPCLSGQECPSSWASWVPSSGHCIPLASMATGCGLPYVPGSSHLCPAHAALCPLLRTNPAHPWSLFGQPLPPQASLYVPTASRCKLIVFFLESNPSGAGEFLQGRDHVSLIFPAPTAGGSVTVWTEAAECIHLWPQ